MKIVVVGGTGLIGAKVVEQLSGGPHEVAAASRATGVNAYTGDGLEEALDGASVVVDVSNSDYLDEAGSLDYFDTETLNLLTYGAAAGVGHHVALSIVGTDRLADGGGGYFRGKQVQERLIRRSGRPFSIVHSTQFFEFIPRIADAALDGQHTKVVQALMQPIAGDDTAAAVVAAALGSPSGGIVEVAGPECAPLADFVQRWFGRGDRVGWIEVDPLAHYFGSKLRERDLLPGPDARLSTLTYRDWLEAATAAAGPA